MAGDRSERTAPGVTADQPPVEGEPTYDPHDDRISPEHEEPIDGPDPEPDPQVAPGDGGTDGDLA